MVIAIALLAFVARVLWILSTAATGPLFDKYFWLAGKLKAVGWLPDVAFTSSPAYTYLFALLTLGLGWGEAGVRLLQAVAGGAAVALAWLSFRELAGRRVALVGALLLALHPTAILYDTQPLPEAWINLANATLLLWLVRHDRERPLRYAVALGAVTGFSVLLRPTALLWLPLLALRFLEARAGRRGAFARPAAAAALAFACAVAPAAWVNWRAEGRIILSTTSGGLNWYNGNSHGNRGYTFRSPAVVKYLEGRIQGFAVTQPVTPEHLAWQQAAGWAVGRELSLAESSDFWSREVMAYARREPRAFLAGLARKGRFFLHGREPHDTESATERSRAFGRVGFWVPAAVWALSLVGMALALTRWRALLAPYGLFVAYFGSCALLYVSSRLRVPAVLPAAFFAAFAVERARDAVARRGWARAGALAAAALLALAFCAWPHRVVREVERGGAVAGLVEQALERYRRGDVAAALAQFERVVAVNPTAAGSIATMLEGDIKGPEVARFVDGLHEMSLASAEDAAQRAVATRIRAAAALMRDAGPGAALPEIDGAISIDPWNWDLHNARARLLARLGRWEEALGAYERAMVCGRNVQPDVGKAWLEMARAALGAGRVAEAREYLRRARFVDPRSVEAARLAAEIG